MTQSASSASVGPSASAADSLPPTVPGWEHRSSGKVRDVYAPTSDGPWGGQDVLLVVASDRISAYDHILATPIPDKGAVLTQLSLWWFEQLSEVPNHLWSTDVPEEVRGRAVICKNLSMFPVECIVRGYLTGSGLASYRETGSIAGIELPAGLVDGSRLETPIFTPTGKAEVGQHDEPVTREELYAEVGHAIGNRLEELSLELYSTAEKIAREQGIILADTKVEFGTDSYRGEITLGDELLTPDSSRFWDASEYEPGKPQPSFDKQFVRDWLRSPESGWDGSDNVPHLPEDVVEKTRARYVEAYERLTGTKF